MSVLPSRGAGTTEVAITERLADRPAPARQSVTPGAGHLAPITHAPVVHAQTANLFQEVEAAGRDPERSAENTETRP